MDSENRNVYLVGFMGTGKSTIGWRLAREMGYQFIDSDQEIERCQGRKISEIFATEGETFFRSLEKDFVEQGHPSEQCVISCGGGLVTQEGMIDLLLQRGTVVCLVASAEAVYSRIKDSKDRPLLQVEDPLQKIRDMLAQRQKYYRKIPNQIMTEGRTIEAIVEQIKRIVDG